MPAYTNAKQTVPPLFQEIMRNYDEQRKIVLAIGYQKATKEDWRELHRLRREMTDYRRAAEKALCWNTDKGNIK